jgi:predicted nuclease with TOPRIM domain
MNRTEEQTIDDLLADYEGLTDLLGELLKREQGTLRAGGSLDESMEEKKSLLEEITVLNARLREFGQERRSMVPALQTRVEALQNKFMLILKQDRAVEKAYLSRSAGAAAPLDFKPVPGRVGLAYGKQTSGSV